MIQIISALGGKSNGSLVSGSLRRKSKKRKCLKELYNAREQNAINSMAKPQKATEELFSFF